ncbi:MAG: isoprenylcysteine carboxylmethyltransferase family protein [Deltaproteobacteria bacterium]|nr:isoprenylcysteine carboxylmethyltransferase family protein [Deltaproteobacteria bacterium]
MSLNARWIDFLYKVATGSKKIRNLFTPMGAIGYAVITVLFVVIALKVDALFNLPELLPTPSNVIVSIPILLFALVMMGWSILNFLKVRGTPVPFNPPPELVTSGPYAFVRNPMLTGIFMLLFGLGVLCGSLSLVFLFTPAFIALNVWELKAIEEPELEKRLGEGYVRYKKRTPMFIPDFRARSKKKM